MDILELIRTADSAAEVFSALSVYAESLRGTPFIPEWCSRLPFDGETDVYRRMLALIATVNLNSQNLLGRHRPTVERAVAVFAAAAWRLRLRRGGRPQPD
jgi:hypothetical protein